MVFVLNFSHILDILFFHFELSFLPELLLDLTSILSCSSFLSAFCLFRFACWIVDMIKKCFAQFASFTFQALLAARALPGLLVYFTCLASLSLLLRLSPLALVPARAFLSILSLLVPFLLVPS